MSKIFTSVDQLIGKTPLLELTHIEKKLGLKAKILAKLEYFNPAGSVKDRVAKAMIDDAQASGKLKPNSVIIEPTSGNTGIGLAAVAVARHLAVPDDKIAYAVEQIEQVEHRLSIKRTPGGVTILDDAFNSNPVGSTMAMEVLGKMPGRGIVVTPGMIELGEQTFELNAQLGDAIARNADIAIIVGHYNRDAIVEGLRRSGMPEDRVRLVDSFAEAQSVLQPMLRAGDTVLYENDLPDTFK